MRIYGLVAFSTSQVWLNCIFELWVGKYWEIFCFRKEICYWWDLFLLHLKVKRDLLWYLITGLPKNSWKSFFWLSLLKKSENFPLFGILRFLTCHFIFSSLKTIQISIKKRFKWKFYDKKADNIFIY